MHIDIVPNRTSSPTILLRESYRDGGKVKKRTLANLTSLPMTQVEAIRAILRGETLVSPQELFEPIASRHHGHVRAVRLAMKQLGFERLLAPTASRERDLVVAMVTARIMAPHSKLATTRWWQTTTLPEEMGVADATEDELYAAMDWLVPRQKTIEQQLAARHLQAGGLVLYDLTSSYVEGTHCPLAARGYNRDGKAGKLQINYGLLTDAAGRPVAVSVVSGNTADPQTLLPQVTKVREEFGLTDLVLVGDRGMIAQRQIDGLKEHEGLSWITALKSGAIAQLLTTESLQLGLFDERNLFEFSSPDYPGERLIACRNPDLARLRTKKREALLAATEAELTKVQQMVTTGRLSGQDQIGVRVGKVVNKYKMAKHLILDIQDTALSWQRDQEKIAAETALDGIYVVRTSVKQERMSSDDAVRNYKNLSQVERAFRSFKSIDLEVRPIWHRLEDRVKAHIFLCMLAYYVKWHMMEAWRPLLFADEDQAAKATRDPVKPARRSQSALDKIRSKKLATGEPVHSFSTLMATLATIVRNVCRQKQGAPIGGTFTMDTLPTAEQQRAYDLLATIKM
jgi:transposase